PPSSSPTRRCLPSTSLSARRCCGCLPTCRRGSASPACSSRTTSPWSSRSPTASSSCMRGASSRRGRATPSSTRRVTPIRAGYSTRSRSSRPRLPAASNCAGATNPPPPMPSEGDRSMSNATAKPKPPKREGHGINLSFYDFGPTPFFASQYDQRFSYCLYVPQDYSETDGRQYDLAVIVHGTGRTAAQYRDRFADFAEKHGCIILAPLFPVGIVEPGELANYKRIEFHGIRY